MPKLLFQDQNQQVYQMPDGRLLQTALPSVQPPAAPSPQWNAPMSAEPTTPELWNAPVSQEPMVQPPIPQVAQKEKPSLLESGYQAQAAGVAGQAKAAYDEGQKAAAARQGMSDYLDDVAKKRQQLFEESNAQTKDAIDQYSAEKAKFKQAEIKDPWAEKSTGAKIGAAIAMGLGALGAAMAKTPNFALDIINKAIDRDLAVQSARLDKQRQVMGEEKDYINVIKNSFATKDQQLLALKDLKLESTINQIEGYKASAAGAEAKAKADQLIGALKVDRVKTAAELADKMSQMKLREAQASAEANKPDELMVPGLGRASTKEGAAKVRELLGDLNGAKSGIDELVKMTESSGKSLSPEARGRAKVIQNTLIGQLRTALTGPGAMNEGERALIEDAIANPATIFSLDAVSKAKLNELKGALDRKIVSAAEAQGIQNVGQKIYAQSPEGKRAAVLEWAKENKGKDPRADQILMNVGE